MINKKKYFIPIILIAILIGYSLNQVYSIPAIIIFEPSILVTEASYIIFKSGSTYYVKNGTSREIKEYETIGLAVQTAINDTYLEDGGTVYIKKMNVTISTPIELKSNVQLTAEHGTTFTFNIGGNLININGDHTVLEDLKIVVSPGAGGNGTRPNAIYCTSRTDVKVIDVHVVGDDTVAYDGTDFRQNCILFEGSVTNSIIKDCEVEKAKTHGIFLYNLCSEVIVSNNRCHGNTRNGIMNDNNAPNCTVIGNICTSNKYNGIFLWHTTSNTVVGNICVNNNQNGIYVTKTCKDNTISGNICNSNTYFGIFITDSSEDNTIVGNTCDDSLGESGIAVTTCDNNNIIGNTCSRNKKHGIILDGADNNSIKDNTCRLNDSGLLKNYSGIFIDADSDNNDIMCNTCKDNNKFGIEIHSADCDSNFIFGNSCYGNTSDDLVDNGIGTVSHCNLLTIGYVE